MPSGRVKKRSEEAQKKSILQQLRELKNDHKIPYLLTFPSKIGQLTFGTKNAVNKFKSEYYSDDGWKEVFQEDGDELIDGGEVEEEDEVADDVHHAMGALIADKLPAPLDLMVYVELWTWINKEIIKEYWAKGGKKKCVKWGDAVFQPSFWIDDLWPWSEVYKHYKELPKSAYTGPGIMTDFLKKVVKKKLDMLGINHNEWITDKFTEADRLHRERHRKKVVPADQNEPENDQNVPENDQNEQEDDENEPENVQNDPENDDDEQDNSQSLPDVPEPVRDESASTNATEERVDGDNANISGLLGKHSNKHKGQSEDIRKNSPPTTLKR